MGLVALDRPPLSVIGAAIETWQDHRAPVELGDDRKQPGHHRDATGEPGGDDRVARRRAAPDSGLALEQTVAPLRRVERAFGGEDVRPLARQNFQEFVNGLPMRGEVLWEE